MRCPDCNKFVSLELQDPEINDESLSGLEISVEVRLARSCADCGTELKEATFNLSGEVDGDTEGHWDAEAGVPLDGHELELSVEVEPTERESNAKKARYRKSFFGVDAQCTVTCSCGADIGTTTLSDEVQASGMDELV